jgi:hypothetical protein
MLDLTIASRSLRPPAAERLLVVVLMLASICQWLGGGVGGDSVALGMGAPLPATWDSGAAAVAPATFPGWRGDSGEPAYRSAPGTLLVREIVIEALPVVAGFGRQRLVRLGRLLLEGG